MKRLLKEYLLENWTLKATALLLALILWLFVRGEKVVAVPLELYLPRYMEVTNEQPTTVEVTMRGAAFSNVLFSQQIPPCIIDLQGAKEGEHLIKITRDLLKIPKGSGIEILKISPEEVRLDLEQTISKEVPIVIPIQGEPAVGYEIYSKIPKPPTVVLTGPRSHIEPLKEAPAEPVSVKGLKQPAKFFVNLDFRDNLIRTSLTAPVQVDIQIGLRRRLFTVEHVPVIIDDAAYLPTPRQISVQIYASPDAFAEITPSDFSAYISAKSLNSLKLPADVKPTIRVSNTLNDFVSIRGTQPPEVVVHQRK